MSLYIMLFASLNLGILSVTVHVFYVPNNTDDSPSLWRLAGIMSQLCPREKHKSEKKLNRTIQMQM